MTKRNDDGYLSEIQGHMDGDAIRTMVEVMIRHVMREELAAHLGAGPHERTGERRGYRNGYKPRKLKTRLGELRFEVPQARGVEPYSPTFFAKWERSERALLTACAEMYFMGVSTRKVKRVLEQMGGFSLSAATVSCVAQELDEKLSEFRNRRLDGDEWPYLMVDATYVKVRRHGRVLSQAVLVVAGVNEGGRREILTWRLADTESEDTWTEVFRELKQRGVSGVQWLVSDGHEGIRAALRAQFPQVAWQRCWTHFMRNVLGKVGHRHRKALSGELVAARKFDQVPVCMAEAERIAACWERQYPRVARQIREQFEQTLAVHGLPPEHRRRVYTTNMMERIMTEVKRRTRVVGIFPSESSCDRLVGAQILERHEGWQCEAARYLVMDHMERKRPGQPGHERAA